MAPLTAGEKTNGPRGLSGSSPGRPRLAKHSRHWDHPACWPAPSSFRTSILGGILLTGYLAGAGAMNLRVNDPLLEKLFWVLFGDGLGGLYLRDDGLAHGHSPVGVGGAENRDGTFDKRKNRSACRFCVASFVLLADLGFGRRKPPENLVSRPGINRR